MIWLINMILGLAVCVGIPVAAVITLWVWLTREPRAQRHD